MLADGFEQQVGHISGFGKEPGRYSTWTETGMSHIAEQHSLRDTLIYYKPKVNIDQQLICASEIIVKKSMLTWLTTVLQPNSKHFHNNK